MAFNMTRSSIIMNDDYWEYDLVLTKTIRVSPGEVRHRGVVPVLAVPGSPPVVRVTAVRVLRQNYR